MNWSEFFAMGGYGLYVWGAYGCTALVLVANVVSAAHKHTAALKMLRAHTRLQGATEK